MKKEIFKLTLISKNNQATGIYIYLPVVRMGDKYFFAEGVKVNRKITKKDIDVNDIKIRREIPQEFYKANGITK
jgi:hypothetical protein